MLATFSEVWAILRTIIIKTFVKYPCQVTRNILKKRPKLPKFAQKRPKLPKLAQKRPELPKFAQ
jgi:hypothetical protein